ncbi:unnamed protein product, partial [Heterotrigona itama]
MGTRREQRANRETINCYRLGKKKNGDFKEPLAIVGYSQRFTKPGTIPGLNIGHAKLPSYSTRNNSLAFRNFIIVIKNEAVRKVPVINAQRERERERERGGWGETGRSLENAARRSATYGGNWFCITKPVVRDNRAVHRRKYEHLPSMNCPIILLFEAKSVDWFPTERPAIRTGSIPRFAMSIPIVDFPRSFSTGGKPVVKQKSIKHDPAYFPRRSDDDLSTLSFQRDSRLIGNSLVARQCRQAAETVAETSDWYEIYMERQRRGSMTLVALSGYSEYQGIAERITGCLENPRIPRPK